MDLQILQWINKNLHGSNFINHIIKYITYLGETGICWIILAIVLMCFKKTRKGGFLLACGICATGVVNNLIQKNIFDRARPFTEDGALVDFINSIGMELPDSPSFPSGHTFSSFCSAMILTLAFKKKGAWSFIPATLISLSRVFLCVHYPTDVLAGMIIGCGVGVATYFIGKWVLFKIDRFIENKRNIKKENHNKNSKESILEQKEDKN